MSKSVKRARSRTQGRSRRADRFLAGREGITGGVRVRRRIRKKRRTKRRVKRKRRREKRTEKQDFLSRKPACRDSRREKENSARTHTPCERRPTRVYFYLNVPSFYLGPDPRETLILLLCPALTGVHSVPAPWINSPAFFLVLANIRACARACRRARPAALKMPRFCPPFSHGAHRNAPTACFIAVSQPFSFSLRLSSFLFHYADSYTLRENSPEK